MIKNDENKIYKSGLFIHILSADSKFIKGYLILMRKKIPSELRKSNN